MECKNYPTLIFQEMSYNITYNLFSSVSLYRKRY